MGKIPVEFLDTLSFRLSFSYCRVWDVRIAFKLALVIIFIVAPCMLILLSHLFVQLMHINCYKIVKELQSFKIIIVVPTCFGLHKPSSGSSQPVPVLSVLWLHMQQQYR